MTAAARWMNHQRDEIDITPHNPHCDPLGGSMEICKVEFQAPGTFKPITDIVRPFGLKPGQWTDDTSMTLCLADSLIEKRGFDPTDQMDRYCRWWKEGYLSSTGACFDIGITVKTALADFLRTGEPFAGSTDPFSAGNGSLMRLAPVVLAFRKL
jgi:ADP-ribosyl-[dinitrogen reductase] hydrolase